MSKKVLPATAPTHIDEIKVRLVATGVFILTLLYTITGHLVFTWILVADFALRAFDYGRISPLARIADWGRSQIRIAPKPIFYPPKRFAARVGLFFSAIIIALELFGFNRFPVAVTLLIFSALEAFAGVCAGCYVYSWLQPLFNKATISPSPAPVTTERPVREITVQELKQWKADNIIFQFIDVREAHEYELAHLGATLIPLGAIMEQSGQIRTDIPVVIHCRSGMRSAKAIRLLEDTFGWDNLYNLKGGILAYQTENDRLGRFD